MLCGSTLHKPREKKKRFKSSPNYSSLQEPARFCISRDSKGVMTVLCTPTQSQSSAFSALWSKRFMTWSRTSCLCLPEDNLSARRAILPSQDLNEGTKNAILTFRCPAPGGTVTLKLDSQVLFFTVSRKNDVLENRIHQSAAQKQAEWLRQAIGNTDDRSGSEVSPLFCVQEPTWDVVFQSTLWIGRTGGFIELLGGFMLAQEGRDLAL